MPGGASSRCAPAQDALCPLVVSENSPPNGAVGAGKWLFTGDGSRVFATAKLPDFHLP